MYNAEKRVVVLESNATLLNELKGAIERQGNFIVAYTGDDGENGVKQIVNSKPDIVIVGTFLKGLDGCNVIREIKAAGCRAKLSRRAFPAKRLSNARYAKARIII